MKTNKKGLQRFTESEIKINEILSLDKDTPIDISELNDSEFSLFRTLVSEKLNTLKGDELAAFIKKVEPILPNSTKNQIWENNHVLITNAIANIIREYHIMPTKSAIAEKTGLSRPTVDKHLSEYTSNPQYLQQIEQFHFMSNKVLARVYQFAVDGNIKAARLYFDIIGRMGYQPNNTTSIKTQNNYIQINGTVIDQDTIKRLNPEQLSTIEKILKALPQVEKVKAETNKKTPPLF